jgi:hypothetical protein
MAFPKIEDTPDGYKVQFHADEVDGLSVELIEVILGDYDDAHLMLELIQRARHISIILPA